MNGLLGRIGLLLIAISTALAVLLFTHALGTSFATEMSEAAIMTIGFSLGLVLMFIQAIIDRVNNKEDNYYSKNVKR